LGRDDHAADALALRSVNALYGDSHVLHDVSFSVKPGRVLALLGRNGAGKTTCMNTIIGFLRPRSGDIRLHGERIAGLSPEVISRRGVGLVPQGRRIFSSLSVYENLRVAQRKPAGLVAQAWTFDDVFATFPRLGERRRQAAGSLSGGEQQMLAIARGLMSQPKLLLLDEPSLGLAPLVVNSIFGVVNDLRSRDIPILLVEQNVKAALKIADRAYIMETGKMVKQGRAEELLGDDEVRKRYLGM
jgi:branched-chain amino acid transport system ATP-binding protein